MNLNLFIFEVKKQSRSILFWICVIFSLCATIRSAICKDCICSLPLSNNKEAYEFNFFVSKGGCYGIKEIRDYCEEKRAYNHIPMYAQNPEEFYKRYDIVKASKVNKIMSKKMGDLRFSQLFFKVYAAEVVNSFTIFIIFFFISAVNRDKIENHNRSYLKHIGIRKYICSKFFGSLVIYLGVAFLSFIFMGVYHHAKVVSAGFTFNYLDLFLPFICFTLPAILFIASSFLLGSILFKNLALMIPCYVLFVLVKQEISSTYFTSVDDALGISKGKIDIYYGLEIQILMFILFLICMFLSYFILLRRTFGRTGQRIKDLA